MSERETRAVRALKARSASQSRFGARFWDGVEREIEALEWADLALFLRADRLPIEPRAAFARGLFGQLEGLARRRWSN
jgi:hypothetical protein